MPYSRDSRADVPKKRRFAGSRMMLSIRCAADVRKIRPVTRLSLKTKQPPHAASGRLKLSRAKPRHGWLPTIAAGDDAIGGGYCRWPRRARPQHGFEGAHVWAMPRHRRLSRLTMIFHGARTRIEDTPTCRQVGISCRRRHEAFAATPREARRSATSCAYAAAKRRPRSKKRHSTAHTTGGGADEPTPPFTPDVYAIPHILREMGVSGAPFSLFSSTLHFSPYLAYGQAAMAGDCRHRMYKMPPAYRARLGGRYFIAVSRRQPAELISSFSPHARRELMPCR